MGLTGWKVLGEAQLYISWHNEGVSSLILQNSLAQMQEIGQEVAQELRQTHRCNCYIKLNGIISVLTSPNAIKARIVRHNVMSNHKNFYRLSRSVAPAMSDLPESNQLPKSNFISKRSTPPTRRGTYCPSSLIPPAAPSAAPASSSPQVNPS